MVRRALVLALLVACGTTNDDRPRTIGYVTEAILVPTCGLAECHATFSQNRGIVFDTVAGARASLVHNLISFDSIKFDPANPNNAGLIIWITQIDPLGLGIGRMPFDSPMPNADVNLLKEFIREGAPGAQCDPATTYSCNNTELFTCKKDWNFDQPAFDCTTSAANATGCAGGQCSCKPGFGECDDNPANGCETKLDKDPNCGTCKHTCDPGTTCTMVGSGGTFSCQ